MKNSTYLLAVLLVFLNLQGCSLFKPVPENYILNITTSANLNPDNEGRSSPLVLRIYELKSPKPFSETDFFDIYDNDKEALGDSLLVKQEMELNPNESRKLEIVLNEKTTHIGLLAAYRDIDKAKWREVIAVNPRKPTGISIYPRRGLNINLNKNEIVIAK